MKFTTPDEDSGREVSIILAEEEKIFQAKGLLLDEPLERLDCSTEGAKLFVETLR